MMMPYDAWRVILRINPSASLDSIGHQVMLKWISDVVHRSFLRKDVKLKADSLTVVEVLLL